MHANSAANCSASGIETFYIDHYLFQPSALLSHVYNRWEHSRQLAVQVHNTLIQTLNQTYEIKNRKVKRAVPIVLLGTFCPGILIELGFLTNEHEAQLLGSQEYQVALASTICNGILKFVKSLQKDT